MVQTTPRFRARRARASHLIEAMEPRLLLTGLTEHAADTSPLVVATSADNTVWVGTFDAHDINHYAADGTLIHSYDVGLGNEVSDLSVAPDGNVWFINPSGSGLYRLNPTTSAIDNFNVNATFEVNHLAIASDGSIWYTDVGDTVTATDEGFDPNLGHFNPATNVTDPLINLGRFNTDPTSIKVSGGSVWVGLEGNQTVNGVYGSSAFAQVTGGAATSYNTPDGNAAVTDILPVADGSVWITTGNNQSNPDVTPQEGIYHVTFPGGTPNFSQNIQLDTSTVHYPAGLVLAPNNKIYLSLVLDSQIDSIDPSAATLSLTTATSTTGMPGYLALGPSSSGTANGGIWFTERDANLFGVYDLPTATVTPVLANGVAQIQQVQNVALPTTPVATFTGPGTLSDYSATVNWGDGSPAVAGTIQTLTGGGYEVLAGGKVYPNEGLYTVTVTITDNTTSQSAVATSQLKVLDTPLTLTSFTVNPLILRITLLTATFTDDLTATVGNFKVKINWGDGKSDSGATVKTSNGHFAVIDLHQYAKKGTYTVTLEVDPLAGISDPTHPILATLHVTV